MNLITLPLRQLLCLLTLTILVPQALAQKPEEHDLKITFTTPVSQAQAKFVHEGIRSQDPDPLVWLDMGAQSAIVRCHVVLDRNELQAVIAPSGLVIARITEIGAGTPTVRSTTDVNEPMPEFIETGDEAMDDLRYELAKRAWVEEHPEGYQELTAPAPVK
jgi:hypothetical protein